MTNPYPDDERHERAVARKVADRYRRMGFDVIEQPQEDELPFDLGGYRPDLLAVKSEDERYVIEVKAASTDLSAERYLEVAEQVSHQTGWRFLLVTEGSPLAQPAGVGEARPLTWQQIEESAVLAVALRKRGQDEAGFLVLWPAFEASMRNRAESEHIPLESAPTSSLVNHLYSLGELSMEQYDAARELLAVWELLAHGYTVDDASESARRLYELVRDLFDEWGPQPASATPGAS